MLLSLLISVSAFAADPQLERGRAAILGMAGCYLVDYSYTETESLKAGYEPDKRVYDVNTDKAVKEWIYAEDLAPGKIRLQHILFAATLAGEPILGTVMKHTGEDWEFNAPFLYDFTSPSHWEVKSLAGTPGLWTRRITNLDDGLRYQCAAAWSMGGGYPEWSCASYAPIPGRESRDMGRRDYNTLDRSTRVVAYTGSWLERQQNTKVIHGADGVRTPLAKELGKNWYVRLPDSECQVAKDFVEPRLPFWQVLREAWDSVFVGDRSFVERPGNGSRYMRMLYLEDDYAMQNLADPTIRAEAKSAILGVIGEFRE